MPNARNYPLDLEILSPKCPVKGLLIYSDAHYSDAHNICGIKPVRAKQNYCNTQ